MATSTKKTSTTKTSSSTSKTSTPVKTTVASKVSAPSKEAQNAVKMGYVKSTADYDNAVSAGKALASKSSSSSSSSTPAPKAPATTSNTSSSMGVKATTPSTGNSNYTGTSIVDYLGSTGQASDYNTRAKLAASSGIQGYTGTATQNTQLLNSLRSSGSNQLPSSQVDPSSTTATYSPQTATDNFLSNTTQETPKEKKVKQVDTAVQPPAVDNVGLIQQLLQLQRKTADDVAPKINDLASLRYRNNQQIANTLGSNGDESLQTGRASIYQNAASQQEGVRQKEIDQILGAAETSAGMLGTGITATMPTQVSPGNALVSPQSGSEIYNGMGGLQGYNNFQYNNRTGNDLGYQATQIANTISQADANFNLLLQKAGVNPTQVSGLNEIIQKVGNFLGANAGAKQTFDATLVSSIGQIIDSGVFTGDERQQIMQEAKQKTGTGLTELYLTLKQVAINKYNVYAAQSKQYANSGTGSVPSNLPTIPNIQGVGAYSPAGQNSGGNNNDPLGIF